MTVLEFLQPGDALLYQARGGFYNWIIAIKTWHTVVHCSAYVGGGESVAARNGIGVGRYPLRLEGLSHVLRPVAPLNLSRAMQRFDREWRGQGYDWLGLIRFASRTPVSATRFNNKQFCSELLARWYREGGCDAFNGEDADAIAPADFLKSPAFRKCEVHDGQITVCETGDGYTFDA